MTTHTILAVIAVATHQSALLSMEHIEIPLRTLDIVYQALGKISQGNSTDPVVHRVLENPTYTGELNQKAPLYGDITEKKVLELIRKKKKAIIEEKTRDDCR